MVKIGEAGGGGGVKNFREGCKGSGTRRKGLGLMWGGRTNIRRPGGGGAKKKLSEGGGSK